MHCDWPADFYEDCASPASEVLFQFFENANDTPPPFQDDPAIIAAGTLLLESSHDATHMANVVNDEDFLLNQIINVVNHTFFSYDEASSHTEDSNSLSPVGSSPSLSLELDISDVESEQDEEALEDEQTDASSTDDYFGEDVVSSSQEMSENDDSHREESSVSIDIEPNSFYEQSESQQEMLSNDSSDDSNSLTSIDKEILRISKSIIEGNPSNENFFDETEKIKSSASSDKQSSSVTLLKPSSSKCDNENTFDEIGVKSHDNVPSCSGKEKSDNETSCDIVVHEQENNESNSVLQSNVALDDSVLESDNENSYLEDSVNSSSTNTNVSEVGAGSSSGPDKSTSKLKHKISSDPEDGVPSKVPKYSSEVVSASNDNLRDQ